MLNSIMKWLGYVPFAALVAAERDLKLQLERVKKADAEIMGRDETINRIRTREAQTAADIKTTLGQLDAYKQRDRPHVFVQEEPKRLSLVLARSAIDPAPLVLKQGVRNKANEAHYADLMKQANILIGDAFAPVKPRGAPLDKPTK